MFRDRLNEDRNYIRGHLCKYPNFNLLPHLKFGAKISTQNLQQSGRYLAANVPAKYFPSIEAHSEALYINLAEPNFFHLNLRFFAHKFLVFIPIFC